MLSVIEYKIKVFQTDALYESFKIQSSKVKKYAFFTYPRGRRRKKVNYRIHKFQTNSSDSSTKLQKFLRSFLHKRTSEVYAK